MSQVNHTSIHAGQQTSNGDSSRGVDALAPAALEQIRDSLRGLKFGTISIIVQDGVIVQIERLEKRRLRRGD